MPSISSLHANPPITIFSLFHDAVLDVQWQIFSQNINTDAYSYKNQTG